jgi:putative endonuclease
MKCYYVYILASNRNGTLYIGMTIDLIRLVGEHRKEEMLGFTRTYHVHMLVHYEQGNTAGAAITREKQLQKWHRKWKLALIEKQNPEWKDFWDDIV